uniref:ArsA/GET3 Anion-transporting ATPase-like domain-containing protein n=1 Tax=Timspurckia oligopyrenoides TaxID=708627 RepID=A0A7S0ZDI5_9RHOD|mmetsp:Transcript_13572/g.24330  ORF Transcript_13572/g.24330 Transcript_13572/m.24330 type:complete len:793 (+) Transcript_13572:55-2433(+)
MNKTSFIPVDSSFLVNSLQNRRYGLSSGCSSTTFVRQHEMLIKSRALRLKRTIGIPSLSLIDSSSQMTHSKTQSHPLSRLLDKSLPHPRFILVGGKGGVGKTTTASALGLHFARSGFKTLVVSTDPAHSLGDAFKLELTSKGIVNVDVSLLPALMNADGAEIEPSTLSALEIDPEQSAAKLQNLLSNLNQLPPNQRQMVEQLGLAEFSEVFSSLPPGADELVALSELLSLVESGDYERVVIDTAPTGHTLRMLAFPDFIDGFLEKAMKLRSRLDSVSKVVGRIMNAQGVNVDIEKASAEVEAFRARLSRLSDLLRDPSLSEFIVVTIATKLAVDESERLVSALCDDGVLVRNVVVNQLVTDSSEAESFVARVVKEQQVSTDRLEAFCESRNSQTSTDTSTAIVESSSAKRIQVCKAPLFDEEIRDLYALRAYGSIALNDFYDLPGSNMDESLASFVFVGGKGGVGKTTTSAALALKYADSGAKTLVLSTDPAHSLGDALNVKLTTGMPELISDQTSSSAIQLYAMEIDTKGAVDEFRRVVSAFAETGGAGLSSKMLKDLGVGEFAAILDNTPPGVDELLALTKVIQLVKEGEFERVVIDTAPTGHTLRLLAFPEFLDALLGKVLMFKKKLDGMIGMLSGGLFGGQSARAQPEALAKAVAKLEEFRRDMATLKEILHDSSSTQFALVCIPTALAVAETERLIASLQDKESVSVRNVVLNQCLPKSAGHEFAQRRRRSQRKYIERLLELKSVTELGFTFIAFSDVELRGLFGLMFLSDMLFRRSPQVSDILNSS